MGRVVLLWLLMRKWRGSCSAWIKCLAKPLGSIRHRRLGIPCSMASLRNPVLKGLGLRPCIQAISDLWVGKATSPEAVMVKKIIQVTSIFYGIDNGAFPMHSFQVFDPVFIEVNTIEEPVKRPAQKKSRLGIQHKGIKGLFGKIIHNVSI
jgi:hypothetical protein